MSFLLAFAPEILLTLGLILTERLQGKRQHDTHINLQAALLQLAIALLILPHIHGWRGHGLLLGANLPFWLGFAIFAVVSDLGEFLFHVAQHRIPFLWQLHALHHSDPNMAALTTRRHFWGDQLIKTVTIWSATLMIITPTPAMLAAYGLVSLWNIFTHSDTRVNIGRWSWTINTPAYHRLHHSSREEDYNRNFAALLPIFDVLMGSYRRPTDYPPTGIEHQPANLWHIAIWPLFLRRKAAEAAAR